MTRKKDDKGVDKVRGSGATKGVKATSSVSEVDRVQGASAVKGVSAVSGVRSTSGISSISLEQRDKLMTMISEEAERLAAQGAIPRNQREVVEQAVRMIIDAALLDSDKEKGS